MRDEITDHVLMGHVMCVTADQRVDVDNGRAAEMVEARREVTRARRAAAEVEDEGRLGRHADGVRAGHLGRGGTPGQPRRNEGVRVVRGLCPPSSSGSPTSKSVGSSGESTRVELSSVTRVASSVCSSMYVGTTDS